MQEAVVRNNSNWMLVRDYLLTANVGRDVFESRTTVPFHVHIDKAIRRSKRTARSRVTFSSV
jgi:hypothetical protein